MKSLINIICTVIKTVVILSVVKFIKSNSKTNLIIFFEKSNK